MRNDRNNAQRVKKKKRREKKREGYCGYLQEYFGHHRRSTRAPDMHVNPDEEKKKSIRYIVFIATS